MNIELENVKQYLRISHNIDDAYIQDLINLAKSLVKEQTGVEYKENDDVYSMAVLQAVSHFYDNRSPISEKAVTQVPYTLDCLIKHIGARGSINE